MNMNVRDNARPGTQNGRLIGWLVSYALDSKGRPFELRTGRHFISAGQAQLDRVIAVSEQTVSTPHMAINALPKHKIIVQDIFSEYGTFITKSGSNQETAVSGPVEIGHGDWLRVGKNMRFQVCLIDAPLR